MEVRCAICGKLQNIGKVHKDYKKIASNPDSVFICEMCNTKLQYQASKDNEIKKNA